MLARRRQLVDLATQMIVGEKVYGGNPLVDLYGGGRLLHGLEMFAGDIVARLEMFAGGNVQQTSDRNVYL